jgi:hypothetical protein
MNKFALVVDSQNLSRATEVKVKYDATPLDQKSALCGGFLLVVFFMAFVVLN